MELIKVDVIGQTCPVPLIEFRKALKKAEKGDIIEITGTHESSKKEIPMAADAVDAKVLSIEENEFTGAWKNDDKKKHEKSQCCIT